MSSKSSRCSANIRSSSCRSATGAAAPWTRSRSWRLPYGALLSSSALIASVVTTWPHLLQRTLPLLDSVITVQLCLSDEWSFWAASHGHGIVHGIKLKPVAAKGGSGK
jgi:hypothetical protein